MSRFLFLLPLICCLVPASAEQLPYLKEILQGRCYFAPPTNNENTDVCPSVVGSIMNLLESHLDADISASDFQSYLQEADFSSPPDKALFYLRFFGASSPSFTPPSGFATPEDTPGGAFLKDLVFCGVDQYGNCSIEKSNAYWTFWEAAYAKFASQVQGHVQIIVEPKADLQFLQRSVILNLQAEMISSITIYGRNEWVDKLTGFLKNVGIENTICKDEIVDFYLDSLGNNPREDSDNNKNESNGDEDESESDSVSKKRGAFGGFVLILLFVVVGLYCFADDYGSKHFPFQSVRDYSKRLFRAIRDFGLRVHTVVRDRFVVNEHDQENTSENSPLVNGAARHDFVVDEFGCRVPTQQVLAQ